MRKTLAFALLSLLGAHAASAATLYSNTTPTGAMDIPGSVSATFNAGGGTGLATFQIQAYNTVDGVNCCTDTFSFIVNGTTLFSGAYDLGGGGTDTTFTPAPSGSTVTIVNGANGTITGSFSLALLNGANTLVLDYAGGSQGIGDEGWGVNSFVVTGDAYTSSAPEPMTWALMVGGFGLVGVALRRTHKMAVSYS